MNHPWAGGVWPLRTPDCVSHGQSRMSLSIQELMRVPGIWAGETDVGATSRDCLAEPRIWPMRRTAITPSIIPDNELETQKAGSWWPRHIRLLTSTPTRKGCGSSPKNRNEHVNQDLGLVGVIYNLWCEWKGWCQCGKVWCFDLILWPGISTPGYRPKGMET